jgi:hypothetical protein
MKKIFALMAIAAVGFIACNKDDDESPAPATGGGSATSFTVEKKNRAAVIYFGEDWCPPCGTNGGPTLDSLLKGEGSLLTGIKINKGSNNTSLNWSGGGSIYNAYNSGVFSGPNQNAIPAMAVNNTEQLVYTNINTNISQVRSKANAFAADSVVAGIALQKSIVGDSIVVDTKVKFFKAQAAGIDYRLALYVVEDDVVASQSTNTGTVANYTNHNLVRVSNAAAYTGVAVNSSAAIAADFQYEKTYKMYLKPAWNKANLKVVAVLWKMGSTPAKVINSNVVL